MPTIVHGFDWPDRVVIGAIGEPGARTFYLQARAGSQVTSVIVEKEQSAALAEKIDEILDLLMAEEGNPFSVPPSTADELIDHDDLDQPVEPEFRVGMFSLGWDPSTSQVVMEAYPFADDSESDFGFSVDDEADDDESVSEPDGPPTIQYDVSHILSVRIPVGSARAFAERARNVVGAGRPSCPLCGRPMDPLGHVCAPPGEP